MRETQKRLKQLRQQAGMTQAELAQLAGMKQQAIQRAEAARVALSLDSFEHLVKILGHHVEIVPDETPIEAQNTTIPSKN